MENPFKNFGKKARNTVIGVAAMSGVTASEGATAQAVQHGPEQAKEQTLGASVKTSWAKEAVAKANVELSYIQTVDDAREFERTSLNSFINNIGMMSQGAETKANYSIDEYRYMEKELEALGKIFDGLEKKLNFKRNPFYQDVHDQLAHKSSYSGYQESQRTAHYSDGQTGQQ